MVDREFVLVGGKFGGNKVFVSKDVYRFYADGDFDVIQISRYPEFETVATYVRSALPGILVPLGSKHSYSNRLKYWYVSEEDVRPMENTHDGA